MGPTTSAMAAGWAVVFLIPVLATGGMAIAGDPAPPARPPRELTGNGAPPWTPNVRVDGDPGTGSQSEVSLAVNANGVWYAGWIDNRHGGWECAYARSTDGGATWSAPEFYNGGKRFCGDPVVVADDVGRMHRLAMPFTDPGADYYLDISTSTDGGATWGQWSTIVGGNVNDKPWLAARGDFLVMAWTTMGGGSLGTTVLRSLDGGLTWGAKKSMGTGSLTCLAIDPGGRAHLSWLNGDEIRYQFSDDKGSTWSQHIKAGDGGQGDSNPRSGPLPTCAVTEDSKHVYLGWAGDTGGGSEDVWVSHSGDRGKTWDAQVKVDADAGKGRQIMPWLAVDSAGTVHIAWTDFRDSNNTEAYYSNSTDLGKTWSANQLVSDGKGLKIGFMGDYTQLAIAPNGDVGYVWCDTRTQGNEGDIYFSKARLASKGGGGGPVVTRIEVLPKSAAITADQTQQFAATAFDQNGNQTNATFSWSASGGTITPTGLFTPGPAGTFTVFANASGKSGSASVTVTPGALVRLEVAPASSSITVDQTQQFAAKGTDRAGNPVPTSPAWSASGGTISGSGLFTPDKTGTFTVKAEASGISATAMVEVRPGALASLVVEPVIATTPADADLAFSAVGRDAKGNLVQVNATWSVEGGPDSGTISPTGVFTPNKVGERIVAASVGALRAEAKVTVVPGKLAQVTISPASARLKVGETQQFTVEASDVRGNRLDSFTTSWKLAGSVGEVTETGEFSATKAGEGKLVATVSDRGISKTAEAALTVEVTAAAGKTGSSAFSDWMLPALLIAIVVVAVCSAAVVAGRRKRRTASLASNWPGSQVAYPGPNGQSAYDTAWHPTDAPGPPTERRW